jgi:hypothetical protein
MASPIRRPRIARDVRPPAPNGRPVTPDMVVRPLVFRGLEAVSPRGGPRIVLRPPPLTLHCSWCRAVVQKPPNRDVKTRAKLRLSAFSQRLRLGTPINSVSYDRTAPKLLLRTENLRNRCTKTAADRCGSHGRHALGCDAMNVDLDDTEQAARSSPSYGAKSRTPAM